MTTPTHESAKAAINEAIALFHKRWVLRILWELRGQPLTFRALREACGGISPTVLNQRLRELRELRLVEHREGVGYTLAQEGQALAEAMRPMLRWAKRWREGRQQEE